MVNEHLYFMSIQKNTAVRIYRAPFAEQLYVKVIEMVDNVMCRHASNYTEKVLGVRFSNLASLANKI
jgi:hypothetical protein